MEKNITLNELKSRMRRQHSAIIVDFDGTLSLRKERKPFDLNRVGEDEPNIPVATIVKYLALFFSIIIVSGRDEECRWQSEMWLHSHEISYRDFFMRPKADNRHDTEIKLEIYEREIKNKYEVLCVLDDRPCVIRMWESLGLFVFNCNNGRGEF